MSLSASFGEEESYILVNQIGWMHITEDIFIDKLQFNI